jgi:hypothetical protein
MALPNFTKTKRENYNAFIVTHSGELQLKDTGQVVVPNDKKQERIKEIYNEFCLGSGRDNTFEKINRRYIGITRADVKDFLSKKFSVSISKSTTNTAQQDDIHLQHK